MFLKSSIRLRKGQAKFLTKNYPWVYSNELTRFDKGINPGSWVSLEDSSGKKVAYGYFNPHSLIAFRVFEKKPFINEEQTRKVFCKRLEQAYERRVCAYKDWIKKGVLGCFSFRLAFGESDGLPGLVIDLFQSASTKGYAVIQSHAAGADQFIFWAQAWLAETLEIQSGVIRNDLDVRDRERVEKSVLEWGLQGQNVYALEGGVRFQVDPKEGQKTGFFYDHRDNRAALSKKVAASFENPYVLDCFSYVGAWGLQVLKRAPKARLLALDISQTSLDLLKENAKDNKLSDRVEVFQTDVIKKTLDLGEFLPKTGFDCVISDPPALTSSAKQALSGKKTLQTTFEKALRLLQPDGIAALASCSFHLSWDEFLETTAAASKRSMFQVQYLGAQSADHPFLANMPETRYLKCVFGQLNSF